MAEAFTNVSELYPLAEDTRSEYCERQLGKEWACNEHRLYVNFLVIVFGSLSVRTSILLRSKDSSSCPYAMALPV
jgi:hypothetical protein